MKRITIALLCALSVLFVFAGCSKNNENGENPSDRMTWTARIETLQQRTNLGKNH